MTKQEQDRLDRIEQRLDYLLAKYNKENQPNRMELNRSLVLKDAQNITEFDNLAGLKLGHSTSKVGFFGSTPVVKAGAVTTANTQGGSYNQSDVQSIASAVNSLITIVKNLGLSA